MLARLIEPDVAKAGGKAVFASAPLHNGHSSMIPLLTLQQRPALLLPCSLWTFTAVNDNGETRDCC